MPPGQCVPGACEGRARSCPESFVAPVGERSARCHPSPWKGATTFEKMVFWFTDFVKFLDFYLAPGVRPSIYFGDSMCRLCQFIEFKNFFDSYIAPGERPPVDPWRGRRVPIHGVIEPQMPTVDDG